jgi:hypothetical protein
MSELERQGILDYEFWDGVYLPSIRASINAAHKQIVEFARLAEYPEVCIAEDDIVGTHPNSWNYFLSQKPKEYDMYLSMVYLGDIIDGRVESFTGMTLYSVSRKFYDKFLSVDPNEHIDRALAGLGDYHVCHPFTFIQRNGFSSNTGKMEEYDQLLNGRILYNG